MGLIKWSEQKIAELQAQGYGQGHGSDYKPWIEVSDFSSKGVSRRAYGQKADRVHHFLSDVEFAIFLLCEWSRSVKEIREQYPLDRELTQTIAQQLKLRHPCYPGTQVPTVMTVDLFLTIIKDGTEQFIAINAKRDDEAEDEGSIEKLEIQRTYFEWVEAPHYLIYHSQLPHQKVKNLKSIWQAQLKENEKEAYKGYYQELCASMSRDLREVGAVAISLTDYCSSFDVRFGLEAGTGLRVARMLMQERALMVDLESKDLIREPLANFLMTSRAGQLRVIGGA